MNPTAQQFKENKEGLLSWWGRMLDLKDDHTQEGITPQQAYRAKASPLSFF